MQEEAFPYDRTIRELIETIFLRFTELLEYSRLIKEVKNMPLVIDKTKDPFYIEGIEKGLILEA